MASDHDEHPEPNEHPLPEVGEPMPPIDFNTFILSMASAALIDLNLKQPLAGRRNFRGRLAAAEAGWRLELEDAGGAASGQALDFTLDEVREARLVPVIDFKGRGARAPKARPAAGLDGGRKE